MDREFWIAVRQAIFIILSAIERELGISPTTKECRDMVQQMQRGNR